MTENEPLIFLWKLVRPLMVTALSICLTVAAIGDEPDLGKSQRNEEEKVRPGKSPGRPGYGRGGMLMKRMFEEADADGDQAVSFEEFSQGERVSKLTGEHQRKLFERLDRNGDGKLDQEDTPPHGGHSRDHSSRGDKDGNGEISFEEFSMSPRMVDKPEKIQRTLFDRMDHNKDGVLSSSDWKNRRGPGGPSWRGGPPGPNPDLDGDGKISFEEFQKHPRHKDQSEDEQEDLFEELDKNSDGFLDENERPKGAPSKRVKPEKKKKDRIKQERQDS